MVKWPKLNLAAMNKRSKYPMIQKPGSLFRKQYLVTFYFAISMWPTVVDLYTLPIYIYIHIYITVVDLYTLYTFI
jgi:hypothetical protein